MSSVGGSQAGVSMFAYVAQFNAMGSKWIQGGLTWRTTRLDRRMCKSNCKQYVQDLLGANSELRRQQRPWAREF